MNKNVINNMNKKTLNTPLVARVQLYVLSDIITSSVPTIDPNESGNGEVAVRQTTDFFGNTVLVPMDDDWE